MKRFRWTRKNYRHAHHLARMLSALHNMPSEKPDIVRRYHELWEQHPHYGDPLLTPVRFRYDPEIPF